MDSSIIDILKHQIEDTPLEAKWEEQGEVIEIADGVATIVGLSHCRYAEKLLIGSESTGMALNLFEDSIGAIIFNNYEKVKVGDKVKLTGEVMNIPASNDLLGRVIDPLGQALDGKPAITADQLMPIEKIAPGVITRESVNSPIQTGIKAIDALIPIGRGQRELIIGDRSTGKTAIAIDTIINQKGTDVVCIYVAIGQKESKIAKLVNKLKEEGALEHTIVMIAGASSSAALNYIAPYAGCAVGEYFMAKGQDVLVVYDDLSKHAWAYRELSLLLKRPPGREAYPGDVFYLHSRLLERSAKLNKDNGGGSLTALPIIETQAGDVSAYIPTNVISITDGQIYLESDLFYQGIRPALNIGLSVSRVGGAAQIKAMKKVAGRLRLDLAQFRELAAFAQFGSDLDAATAALIERGKRLTEVLKQPQYEPMPVEEQVVILFAVTNGLFDDIAVEKIVATQNSVLRALRNTKTELLNTIRSKKELDETLQTAITQAVNDIIGLKTSRTVVSTDMPKKKKLKKKLKHH
jgi:F-type H+-transporting ATPase subunit alpha